MEIEKEIDFRTAQENNKTAALLADLVVIQLLNIFLDLNDEDFHGNETNQELTLQWVAYA
jgi:hypothetical protein